MKEVTPNYYKKFQCIADKCKHSCCIGWEIDIDEDTYDLYNSLDTPFGERIRNCIEGEVPHFKLTKDKRCPFLNEKGLCDIILEYGDGAICDICYLHPRFSNFYSSFEETGLGLCCEEVVRIILTEEEKFLLELPDDISVTKEERAFFEKRQKIFDILQDRSKSITDRFKMLGRFEFDIGHLSDIYLSLERLDENWTEEINNIKEYDFKGEIFDKYGIFFEQLAVYFIFRHLKPESDFRSVTEFMLMSCYFIGAMCEKSGSEFKKMADIVRMYSSEIEYSRENLDILYN